MLETWSKQLFPIKLYISISFEKNIEDKIDNFFKKYENKNLIIIKHYNRLYQFEHFRHILRDIDDETYLIFTDDDDMWSYSRSYVYNEIIKKCKDECFSIINSTISFSSKLNSIHYLQRSEYIEICVKVKNTKL